ncbi:hypothetical protein Tco_0412660 [Tanacetum coccineum]
MNLIAAQQVALDNALVGPEKRLKIEKCNARIEFSKPQREETYQVTLDALKLSPCYHPFLITDEVAKELDYSGKCDTLSAIHILREHLLLSSTGASLKSHHDLIGSGHQELKSCGMYEALISEEMINQYIKDSKAYKTYLNFATRKTTPKKARKFRKVDSPSKKLDTPGVSVSKKKAPTKVDRGKGMDLLFEATLLEAGQLKKTLKKRKQETHKLHASGLGDGVSSQPKLPDEQQDKTTGRNEGTSTIPGVPDVPKYQFGSENESWGNSEDDGSNDDDKDDVTNDDDDDVDSDVDEYKEEYVRTPDNYEFFDADEEYEELYKDVNVRLKDAEHEEEGKRDAEMTDAGHDDGTQHTTYEQVKDDEHVILTTVHDTQNTEVLLQSSSISSDFANHFINLDNALPFDNEVMSMMNVKVCHEEPSTQTPSLLIIHVTVIPETLTAAAPTIPPTIPPITPLPQ